MKSSVVSVGSTATLICAADDIPRTIYVHNAGGAKIYVGGSTVTTTTGYHIGNNESADFFIPVRQTLYGVVASGTNDTIVLTPDTD